MIEPLLDIELYTTPPEFCAVHFSSANDREPIEYVRAIEGIIEELTEGITPAPPGSAEREHLEQRLRNNPFWQESASALIASLTGIPQSQALDLLGYLHSPVWNDLLVRSNGDAYDSGSKTLSIDGTIAHSYLPQLNGKDSRIVRNGDSLSVSCVTIASDGIVLGMRAGKNLRDTIMTTPAGSVQYHDSPDVLRDSARHEYTEELGLAVKNDSLRVIAKLTGTHLPNWPHYVVAHATDHSVEQLCNLQRTAPHAWEHSHLVPYRDDPQEFLAELATQLFDPDLQKECAPGVVAARNMGKVLPQAAASVLAHHASKTPQLYEGTLLNGKFHLHLL